MADFIYTVNNDMGVFPQVFGIADRESDKIFEIQDGGREFY